MEFEKIEQKIKEIEKEIAALPYHKGTEHHIGKLKAKLAKLRDQLVEKRMKKKGGSGFAIKKQGDATVVFVGFPSVGKSTLLNKLTNAKSKVAPYAFTTLRVIPGMLEYRGAKIQILDVPGLIKGAALGKGRGKEVLSVARGADLLLLLASVEDPKGFKIMEKELSLAGVRINQKKPEVLIEKKVRGGIEIAGQEKSLSKQTIKFLSQEFSLLNAKITFKKDVDQDQFIDVLMGNRAYVPALKVLTKIDLISSQKLKNIIQETDYLPVSVKQNQGLKKLKQKIFSKLNLIRVYLKESGKARPQKQPLVCKKGTTVLEAAQKISEELSQEIKGAKITGPSVTHSGQFVGPKYKLLDKDQVFFVK